MVLTGTQKASAELFSNLRWLFVGLILVSTLACNAMKTGVYREDLVTDSGEPAYITVQHCLIAFQGTVGPNVVRTQEEAAALANELYDRLKNGEDFDSIIRKYTDDSPPGIYRMANRGYDSDMSSPIAGNQVHARDGMVPAFGDVGFSLEVGEYGMAPFEATSSPFGWHIIKRLK